MEKFTTGTSELASVHLEFAKLEECALLGNNPPRYHGFLWEDVDRFREYFGPDVDPIEHGRHQAETVAIPFVEADYFTVEEGNLLVLTNLVHDYHEGVTGDILYPDKTVESDRAELEVSQNILKKFMTPELVEQIGKVMGDFEGETRLGRAFSAIEQIGYCTTGLKAWRGRSRQDFTPEERGKCYSMGKNVVQGSSEALEGYQKEFPYVSKFLHNNYKSILQVRGIRGMY